MTESPPTAPPRSARPPVGRATAWIAAGVLGLVTLLGFAAPFLPAELAQSLQTALSDVRAEPWAPIAAVAAYVGLAVLGVPQIVLITAQVVVFGAWIGFVLSWIGKLIACAIGFYFGRRFGAGIVARNQSPQLAEFMAAVGRHGFWISAGIRLVPTVPSVLINIAAGATPIRFRDFIAGTALGSVPKMALMAFGGAAAMTAMREHSLAAWLALGAIVALYALLALAGKAWMKRNRQRAE